MRLSRGDLGFKAIRGSGPNSALVARQLNRKARPAAAGRSGVGVVYLEGGTDQLVGEIDLAAFHIHLRDRIDQNRDTALFDGEIIIAAVLDQIEFVLKPGAAATFDGHTQHRVAALIGDNYRDLFGGAV